MFRLATYETVTFKDTFNSIAKLIEEGVIKISKEGGLSLTAADKAMVSVVRLKILPTAFDEMKIDENEYSVGLNIEELASILKRGTKRDKLIIESQNLSRVDIIFKNSSTRKFSLPVLSITEEELPSIDQLEFKARVEISSDAFKKAIEDAKLVSDEVVFEATNDKFVIKAEGEISSTEIEFSKDQESLFDLKITDGEEKVAARYPIDYLRNMAIAARVADYVVIEWSTDYPAKLTFKETDKIILEFVVAPRVTE